MEFLFIILPIVLVILTFLISNNFLSRKTTLPGELGWPLLGESFDYFNKLRSGISERFVIERKRKHSSNIFKTSILGEKMAFLTGPEGNKFLFSNENKLVQVWWPSSVERIIQKSRGKLPQDESARVRVLLPQFLKAHAIKNYVSTMDFELKQHVADHWIGRQNVVVCDLVRKYTFALAVRLFLSVKDPGELEKLARPFEEAAGGIIAIPINFPGTRFNRGINASKRIRKVIEEIIRRRREDLCEGRATASQDMLTHMIVEVDRKNKEDLGKDPTTDSDIASDILGLLIGGYDTINTNIVFVMMTLVEYPDVYEHVLKEQREIAKSKAAGELLNWDDLGKMKYSWNVACEVLRMRPPTVGAFRVAKTDFNYGGHTIPRGWKLHYIPHFTQKNPDYFPNPEKFDPSRFEGDGPAYTFVPFGGGPRMCPGNEYARAEIPEFMHNIITRYNWEKLIPDEKVVIDPLPRPAQGLPIFLTTFENVRYVDDGLISLSLMMA